MTIQFGDYAIQFDDFLEEFEIDADDCFAKNELQTAEVSILNPSFLERFVDENLVFQDLKNDPGIEIKISICGREVGEVREFFFEEENKEGKKVVLYDATVTFCRN